MRLISAIFFLIKLDDNKRELTINLIKTRVNGRIASKNNNLDNINDILFELIHQLQTFTKCFKDLTDNIKHDNSNYILQMQKLQTFTIL